MNYDTISRADVIKIIKSVLSPASSLINVARARRQMLDRINELESNPESHWIPVTERLPEDYQDVLICGEGDFIICAQLIKGLFECGELDIYGSIDGSKVIGADTFNVLAWMPLPEPYKGVTT